MDHRFAGALLLATIAGCAPALVHPMRVHDGLISEVGLTFTVPEGRKVYCDEFCARGGTGFVPQGPFPYGTMAYGAVVREHIGLMFGLSWPNRSDGYDLKLDGEVGPRLVGLATLQNDVASVGLGADVGITGLGVSVLVEARPGGEAQWVPSVGVFHRWWVPYVVRHARPFEGYADPLYRIDEPIGWELGGIEPSFDIGARITIGPFLLQYSLQGQVRGLRSFQIPLETQTHSQFRHILSVGINPDEFRNYPLRGR